MILTSNAPVLAIVIPLMTAVLIPIVARFSREDVWRVCTAAMATSAWFSWRMLGTVREYGPISYWLGGWEPPWGIEYRVDELNAMVLVIVSCISLLCVIYARHSVRCEIEAHRRPLFYSVFMLLVTGMMGIVVTGDIFNVYVFLEISSLSGYALIALGRRRGALTASYNYLILGTIGATFILLGIGHLYMVTGTLNIADLQRLLPPLYGSRVVKTAFALFTVGVSLKLALFPLHVWMPKAYAEAPSAVGALLGATSTKVGAYVLLRILYTVFGVRFWTEAVPLDHVLVVMGSVAILAGSMLAVAQTDLKRMLAYSSVGQIGYIVVGAALVNQTALTGGLLHILNHALMKGGLFMAAGAILYSTGIEGIAGLRGLGRRLPLTMAAFTVCALSMIGVPLTVGFTSKWYLVLGAIEAGKWYVAPVILVSSALTAIYFWRVIEGIYFGEGARTDTREAPAGLLAPLCVMAGLCVILGTWAGPPIDVAGGAASWLMDSVAGGGVR